MNEVLMCGTDPVGQLYKDTKAEATSIAPIEVSPAESSHNVGTHIMYGGIRYKVTSAISIGDTLTIGTNISAENIEDNLNADDIAYDSSNSVKDMIDGKLFATDVVNTGSFTVNAGTYADKSMLIPVKSGYTPIGVISWQLRTAIGTLVKAVISQTGNDYYLDITVGNPGTGTINPNADFSVLYMKS